MSSSKQTTDHKEIKQWTESRDGVPTVIEGTENKGSGEGLLRIHFPKASSDDNFKEISWDEFFKEFDDKDLAFVYQDDKDSTFHKLVSRED
ncbi:MAG: hypothetical protein ACLFUB_10480 [Cyclobacteriaceae bacterium]